MTCHKYVSRWVSVSICVNVWLLSLKCIPAATLPENGFVSTILYFISELVRNWKSPVKKAGGRKTEALGSWCRQKENRSSGDLGNILRLTGGQGDPVVHRRTNGQRFRFPISYFSFRAETVWVQYIVLKKARKYLPWCFCNISMSVFCRC